MKQARVLFDEFHSEAWSVRPETAERMQPAHPADSSYALAAKALAAHDFTVAANTDRPLTDVRADADVVVLAETEQDKYGNNLNELLARFGIHVESATVQDYEHHRNAPSWVLAELPDAHDGHGDPDLLARVHRACFYRAGTLVLGNGGRVLARTFTTASPPDA